MITCLVLCEILTKLTWTTITQIPNIANKNTALSIPLLRFVFLTTTKNCLLFKLSKTN